MPIKKISQFVTYAALFLIPIFPLIVANSFFFPFITGKAFYFRLLVEIAFAGWIILAFIDAKYRPKLTPITIGVTLFAVIALIADLLGVNPIRSLWSNFERMEGWIVIVHLWAFFMVTTNLFGSEEFGKRIWHRWINVSLIVAVVVAFYGLFQLFGWAAIHQGSSRIDASLGNAAYMAVYMLINAGLAVYMFFVAKAKKIANADFLKWAYPVIAVLFSFELFETATRGTILGLIGGIMLALFLYSILGKKESKKSRMYAGGIILAISLIGLVFWLNRNSSFVQNNQVLNRLATISLNDVKTQARGYIWPMALTGAMERPILGWGQENFNYIFNANYNPAMYSQEQWFDRAHNVFLDWLVASGFVGLIAYLSLYVLFLMAIWKSKLSITEKSVFTGLLAGYIIHNIFVFDNLASYVLFFTMLGFADSLKAGQPLKILGNKPLRNDAVEYIVAPIVIVALVFVLYFFEYRPVQANTRLIAALQSCSGGQPDAALFEKALKVNVYMANQEIREQILQCSGQVVSSQQIAGPIKQAYFTLASNQIQAQVAATPKDARIYSLAGSFLNGVGQYSQAEPLLLKAHELSPDKQSITFELATDYLNSGNKEAALELMKKAYESAPQYWQAQYAYATTLIIAGQEKVAKTIFGADSAVFNTSQVAQAYSMQKEYVKAIAIYKNLVKASPSDINLIYQLSQNQYSAGQLADAIASLRSIEKLKPEYTDQIESAIKQVQK